MWELVWSWEMCGGSVSSIVEYPDARGTSLAILASTLTPSESKG